MNKTLLKQVVSDHLQELVTDFEGLLPRSSKSILSDLITSSGLVKVVLGARRSGKSSLCRSVLPKGEVGYVNFDDERLIELSVKDLQKVYEVCLELVPRMKILFFDEIQNIAGWELFVSRLQRSKHNIVITGSNGKLLGQDLATHLTGRQISLTIRPLSFREYVTWKAPGLLEKKSALLSSGQRSSLASHFSDYFRCGGFPEVILGEPQREYLQELFSRIVTRDIVQRFKIRESKLLKEIALYLIQHSSQKLSIGNLRNHYQLKSVVTVSKYIQLLQDVFLVEELRGYSYKFRERSTSTRKIYACDLGMMNALWSKPTEDLGAKLETLVFLELLNRKSEIYYLNEDSREVDFCVLHNSKPSQLIQVCVDLNDAKTKDREIRSLVELGAKYKVSNLLIVTKDTEDLLTIGSKEIRVIPAYQFCIN